MRSLTLILSLLMAMPALAQQREWKRADPAVACVDAKDKTLCAELLEMRDNDQIARFASMNKRDDPKLTAEVERVDSENIARVEAIIEKHGWPGKTLVGSKASGAAWTIIQHASLEVQEKYFDMMQAAVDAGELDGSLLALTVDRIRMREGRPQIYGTQFHEVDGEMRPYPIEDEANVDARRAKVGLQPLAEYTALMKQMYQPRTIQKKE